MAFLKLSQLLTLLAACPAYGEMMSRMPEGSWDAHIHVVDPTRYPLDPNASYTPRVHTAWDNVLFEDSIGCSHNLIVQPSIYGYDNSCALDALRAYGPGRARAVVVFDPEQGGVTAAELQEWHALGVRGVRLNIISGGRRVPAAEVRRTIEMYAEAVRPWDWVVQLNVPMAMIPELEALLLGLRTRVCFDHFAKPEVPDEAAVGGRAGSSSIDPYSVEGFASLVRLVERGTAWVKISGPYTISKTGGPEYRDLDPFAQELFRVGRTRVMFGSDWPHTTDEDLDIRPWVEHLLDLTEDDRELRNNLFRDNSRRLWSSDTLCIEEAYM